MKNLLGRLMSRPLDELKGISAAWGTLTSDPNPSHNDLAIAAYHTMVDLSAVRGTWGNLDPEARAFIAWLLNQRNMLALVDDLPAHLDLPPDEVAPLLERTRRIGLVDVDEALVRGSRVVSSGDNLYAWGARNPTEAVRRRVVSVAAEAAKGLREVMEENKRPPQFDEPFETLLGNLTQEQVQKVASAWRLPEVARYYKSELVGVMSEFLATGQGREALLSPLPAESKLVFNYLESQGGKATAGQIKHEFEWGERDLRAATLPLIQRAVVWDVLADDRRYLFLPTDLLGGRQSGPSKIAPAMLPKLETSAPYTTESRLPYELPWDLLTLLAAATEQELSLTLQDSRITKRLAKKINDTFLHPTDMKAGSDYIDMVVHLASSLGLLAEQDGEQPTLALTPRADEWAKLSFDAQRRRLFGMWQEDRKWAEPATYGTIYWWNSDLTGARKRLINHLVELPAMQWTSLEAFLRKIHLTEPFLIWSQEELMRRFGLRALQGFRNQWFDIEGRIIADMLKMIPFWLGAVDLGRDKQRRLISFRVTEEGMSLFNPDHAADTGHVPAKTLMVQPNFEVLVLHPDSRVIWTLLRAADLVRHDRVSVYNLNKESVLRATETGLSPDALKKFLDANTGKGLPQNVAHSISDWAGLIKRANIQRTTLIEVDDPAVLDEMMASRKTKRYIARRLSPTIAVAALPDVIETARDDPWHRLMKELKGAGYFPRFIGETTQTAGHASVPSGNDEVAARANGKETAQETEISTVKRRATTANTSATRAATRTAGASRTGIN